MTEDSVESRYHHELGEALIALMIDDPSREDGDLYVNNPLPGQAVVDGEIDYVTLGHWMSEAFSTVVSKYHEEDK